MKVSEEVEKFYENEMLDIISKNQNSIIKGNIENNVKKILYLSSFLLETRNCEFMTYNPILSKKNKHIFTILEKITPNEWVIKDKNNNKYTIYRGEDNMFRLNKRILYCYPLLPEKNQI